MSQPDGAESSGGMGGEEISEPADIKSMLAAARRQTDREESKRAGSPPQPDVGRESGPESDSDGETGPARNQAAREKAKSKTRKRKAPATKDSGDEGDEGGSEGSDSGTDETSSDAKSARPSARHSDAHTYKRTGDGKFKRDKDGKRIKYRKPSSVQNAKKATQVRLEKMRKEKERQEKMFIKMKKEILKEMMKERDNEYQAMLNARTKKKYRKYSSSEEEDDRSYYQRNRPPYQNRVVTRDQLYTNSYTQPGAYQRSADILAC